jgi:hypothetical protein
VSTIWGDLLWCDGGWPAVPRSLWSVSAGNLLALSLRNTLVRVNQLGYGPREAVPDPVNSGRSISYSSGNRRAVLTCSQAERS